jgi:hypothetical protein
VTEKLERLRSLVTKPRSNSYWGMLTEKQKALVQSILFAPGVSLREAAQRVPPTPGGPQIGRPPCLANLSNIRRQLKAEEMVFHIEEEEELIEGIRAQLRTGKAMTREQERLLDETMIVIGREVMSKTLERLDPASRTAAARLLLKRADQRRVDRHQDFVEAQARKNEAPPAPALPLTADEKRAAVKKILGIS